MREILPILPRPSRYLGLEDGACRRAPESARVHLGLAFPDTYEVGMSYLGQKILYGIVNARPEWLAERVMAPDPETGQILRASKTSLATLESDTPLHRLDCLAFSITHELCYTNVLYMLDLGGIALRTIERGEDLRQCPLVIAGGGALLPAEALAPFIDLMALGDGEQILPEILELLEQALARGMGRSDFLLSASRIPGVYVPSLFQPGADGRLVATVADYRPARRIVADLDQATYPACQVVPIGAVHNRLSLEIARGCTRGCRFCHAGMVYRPVRERSLDKIHSLLDSCLAETGFEEISFLSLSTGDFSALKTLANKVLDRCHDEQIGLSLPSLRVGSIDDQIMARMAGVRRTGVTLAPEAGSQRLRDVINKGVTEEGVILHVQKLLEHGWRQVKLYFMIGLPTETDEDLAAIADLCRKVRDAAGRGGPRLQVTAALSPFVPKPFTPFQWEDQISLEEMKRRIYLVRELFKQHRGLTMRWHEPAMSHLEGILSRVDRRMADVVEKAYRKGAIFSSWVEHFALEPWYEALAECGIEPETAILGPAIDAPLPWDHLESGISREFLLREREKALRARTTPDCRYGACQMCGACDTKAGPSRLPHVCGADRHRNILVFAQRDQEAHAARRDAEGRLILGPTKSAPPQIAAQLTQKAAHYRVWHARLGGSAWLSQLELQAILTRALRRAGLPLSFSQGFHPLPLISFGRALPVGVESQAEWFGLSLHTLLPAPAVGQKLGLFLPPGMEIVRVDFVDGKRKTEQAIAEEFLLALDSCLPEATANAWADGARKLFAEFAAKDEYLHTRPTKKGERTDDLRPLLAKWQAVEEQDGLPDKPVLSFLADWSEGYLSPLTLCLVILASLAPEAELRRHLRLTKTSQVFVDGQNSP